MDPLSVLSVMTSTITLIEAATSSYRFLSEVPQAEVKFEELCSELKRLTNVLHSINGMRTEAKSNVLAFAPVDQDLWKQSELAFSDCEKTLDELTALVDRMKESMTSRMFLRKLRLATHLRLQAKDLASFKEKIHTSNTSFQTLLQVLNVSLSIRNSKSQLDLLTALKELKRVIDESQCDKTDSSLFSTSHKQLIDNQRELVRVARSFYSTASSIASTRHGTVDGSQAASSDLPSIRIATGSVNESDNVSSLTPQRRRQIEDYIASTPNQYSRRSTHTTDRLPSPVQVPTRRPSPPLTADDVIRKHPSSDSDLGPDHVVYMGLNHLAQMYIWNHEFAKAEDVLRQALRQCRSQPEPESHHVRMRTQLVLVGFLQGKGRDMEASVLDLAKFHVSETVASQLLYILILANVLEKDHDAAIRLFPELYRRKTMSPTKVERWQLLAASYRLAGENYNAKAIEVMFPTLRSEEGLPTVMGVILRSDELMLELVGPNRVSQIPDFKENLAKAEQHRQVPRSPMRIRWLRGKSKIVSDEETFVATHDSNLGDEEVSIYESAQYSDAGIPMATSSGEDRRKWWRRAKSFHSSPNDARKAFLTIDNMRVPHREGLSQKTRGLRMIQFLAKYTGIAGNINESMAGSLPSETVAFASSRNMGMVENHLVHPPTTEETSSSPSPGPAELSDNVMPPELADTSIPVDRAEMGDTVVTMKDIMARHIEVATSRADITRNKSCASDTSISPPPSVKPAKIDPGKALHSPGRFPRLEKALSRYPSQVQVQEEKGWQSCTVDSGYGSGQGSRSIPNLYPGDPRQVSHERRLRMILRLKITIPILSPGSVIETSMEDTDESKMAIFHHLAGHEGVKGANLTRSKAVSYRNQEAKARKVRGIGISRKVGILEQASQEMDVPLNDGDISTIGRAVTVDEPTILRYISTPAERHDQGGKYQHEQTVDNFKLGAFSWELPEADHVYERQKSLVKQEKPGLQLRFEDDTECIMSGAL